MTAQAGARKRLEAQGYAGVGDRTLRHGLPVESGTAEP